MPRTTRPIAWEDDFSRNSLDFGDFGSQIEMSSLAPDRVAKLFHGCVDPSIREPVNLAEALAADSCPIPSDEDREGYSTGNHEWFWISGLVDWLKMKRVLEQQGLQARRALDMGAATGRVLRHLVAQARIPELWAFDINLRHVRWINRFLHPAIRSFHNSALPHLPIADDRLDLACAFSVFTHIDTFETAWIAELYRILRPGGLAYITFQTEHTWQALATAPDDDRRLKVMGQSDWFRPEMLRSPLPAERIIFRHTDVGPYRGMGFHHSSYIHRTWEPWFEVVELKPLYHGRDQTVGVFRKRADN